MQVKMNPAGQTFFKKILQGNQVVSQTWSAREQDIIRLRNPRAR